jgi:hypothetical protein
LSSRRQRDDDDGEQAFAVPAHLQDLVPPPGGRDEGRDDLIRCECRACGAHTSVRMAVTVPGPCENCGRYELRPLDSGGDAS